MKINKKEIEIIMHWISLVEGEYGNIDDCDEIKLMEKLGYEGQL